MENLAHKLHDLHQKATDKNFPAGVLLARQMNKNSCNFHACQKEHTACYCLEQTLHPLQHDLAREQSVCTVAILLFTHTHTHPPNKTTKKKDIKLSTTFLQQRHTIRLSTTINPSHNQSGMNDKPNSPSPSVAKSLTLHGGQLLPCPGSQGLVLLAPTASSTVLWYRQHRQQHTGCVSQSLRLVIDTRCPTPLRQSRPAEWRRRWQVPARAARFDPGSESICLHTGQSNQSLLPCCPWQSPRGGTR